MVEAIDLKKIRRRVAVSYHNDGVMELYLGFVLTMIGILEMRQVYWGGEGFLPIYSPAIVVFPLFFALVAKLRMTVPRVGYVNMKHKEYRANRFHLVLVAVIAIGLFGLVYLLQTSQVAAGTEGAHKPYLGLYFAAFVAGVISLTAVGGESPRMHLGSAFFLVVFGVLFLLKLNVSVGFLITGVGLLGTGTVMLTRFLRNNPVLPADDLASNESGGGNG
jgi:hypothetical protein